MSRSLRLCPGTSDLPCRELCDPEGGCAVEARMLPGVLTGETTSADVTLPSTRLTTAVDKRGYVDVVGLAWHDVTCPEASACADRTMHAASATLARSGVLERFMTRLAELGRQHA